MPKMVARSGRQRPRVLMLAFSEVKHDGRVLRAADALSKEYNVFLVGLGDCPLRPDVPISYMQVRIPSGLRWWRFALFFIKAVLIGLRVRPHIVHAHDYFLVFHGWVIAELTRAVCVYDAHEFLPGIRERSRVRHWLFTALERASIKHCDLVIATSEERAQAIEDHYGLREPPVVVGNIASSEDGPLDTSGEMTAYDLESVIKRGLPVVVYQGAMDIHCRCLDNLLRAFSDLREDCSLVMAGDGPDLDHLRKLTANLGLEHSVLFTGRLSRSQLVSVMRAASIGVVIYSNKEVNNILCTPNKLHEYARAGLAVVTSNQPPLAQMLGEHPIGELFDPDRPETIQQAIRTVLSSLDAYESRIPAFLAQHDWNNERARLLEAYARLRA